VPLNERAGAAGRNDGRGRETGRHAAGADAPAAEARAQTILAHDDNDDPCESQVTETLEFDLFPLQLAFRQRVSFQEMDVGLILRLQDLRLDYPTSL
jgi:hypothetical protein